MLYSSVVSWGAGTGGDRWESTHSAHMGYVWISNMWGKLDYSVPDIEIAGGLFGKRSLSHL